MPSLLDVDNSFSGVMATAVGWGKTVETDTDLQDRLQQVDVEVISNVLCAADYGPMINDGHLCTDTNYGSKVDFKMDFSPFI